jgi:Thioredoxin domain-containing protein
MHRRRLDSWKAIAEFLEKSLRTVQRWHELNGLPVHHFGGESGSVFAYEDEIDAWLASLAEKPRRLCLVVEKQHDATSRLSQELSATADRMWDTRAVGNIQTIAELYREAIDKDPNNSRAFVGLANALIFSALTGVMEGALAFPMALDALRRTPPIEADSIELQCPKAWLELLYRQNWRKAHAGFETVVSKCPSSSFARAGLALSNVAIGNLEGGVECAWEAWRLNPLIRSLSGILCWIVYLSGDFRQVLKLTAQMRSSGGYGPVTGMVEALVLAQAADPASTIAELEKVASDESQNLLIQSALGYAYAIVGERGKARLKQEQILRWAEQSRSHKGYALSLISLGLGEELEAVSWLEVSYGERCLWTLGYRFDPLLRNLRGVPQFDALVSRIGEPSMNCTVPDADVFAVVGAD